MATQQQPLNPYEAIDIALHLANQIGGPVKVTHLGHAKGGSQIGQHPKAGQSYTIVYPEPK
jgi:hypothetical protein